MNERLARHFLRRLCHETERSAIEQAIAAGLVRDERLNVGGRVLRVFSPGVAHRQDTSAHQVTAMLRRRRRIISSERANPVLVDGVFVDEDETPGCSGSANRDAPVARTHAGSRDQSIVELLRAVRAAAEPPLAAEAATLLLVAQSFSNDAHAHRDVLKVMRHRQPIITVTCDIRGFEDTFLDLLERGMVLPGKVSRFTDTPLSETASSASCAA